MARARGGEVGAGIEAGGSARKCGEESGFGGTEVGGWFSKVMSTGGGDARLEIAVFQTIEVSGEDAIFGPAGLQTECQPDFGELAPDGPWCRFGEFDELLADR